MFDLPETLASPPSPKLEDTDAIQPEYFTETEIRRLERENILTILRKTGWKIKGVSGAAELLGVKPTTLISRIEKMGLKREPGAEYAQCKFTPSRL